MRLQDDGRPGCYTYAGVRIPGCWSRVVDPDAPCTCPVALRFDPPAPWSAVADAVGMVTDHLEPAGRGRWSRRNTQRRFWPALIVFVVLEDDVRALPVVNRRYLGFDVKPFADVDDLRTWSARAQRRGALVVWLQVNGDDHVGG